MRNQNTFTSPTLKYRQTWVEFSYHLDICRVTMSSYVEHPCMNLNNSPYFCKNFRVQVSVLVRYVAASPGCWYPTFRDGVVVSSALVQCPVPPSDVVPNPTRAKPSAVPQWKLRILQSCMSLPLTNLHNTSLNLLSILKLSIPCIYLMVIISLKYQVLIIIHVLFCIREFFLYIKK